MTSSHEIHRRLMVRFEGHVQGVGFRMTVAGLARSYRVTGFVRNLMDGDVDMVVEGTEREVDAFYQAVRASAVFRFVTREEVRWSTASGEFSCFDIRFA